jgi:hypothetical protein
MATLKDKPRSLEELARCIWSDLSKEQDAKATKPTTVYTEQKRLLGLVRKDEPKRRT